MSLQLHFERLKIIPNSVRCLVQGYLRTIVGCDEVPVLIHSWCILYYPGKNYEDCQDPEEIYDRFEALGSCRWGMAYKAMDKRDAEIVAIKCLQILIGSNRDYAHSSERHGDVTDRETVANKIAKFMSCESPFIVKHHGLLVLAKHPAMHACGGHASGDYFETWMVMEYCDAGSLLDLMKMSGEGLNEQLIRIVLKQVLRGLVYLHSKGIKHYAIMCKNLMLNHHGQNGSSTSQGHDPQLLLECARDITGWQARLQGGYLVAGHHCHRDGDGKPSAL